MKAITIIKKTCGLLIIGLIGSTATAQDKKEVRKEEYRIKVIKYENDKKQMIDTVFTNKEDFEAFHKAHVSSHKYYDMLTHKVVNEKMKDCPAMGKKKDCPMKGKKKDCPAMGKKKDCPFAMKFDSLSGKHVKVEVVKIYRKIEIIDASESVIEEAQHPQIQQAAKEDKLTLKNVSVYPNPSNGNISLELETDESNKIELLVTDVQGKEIFKDNFLSTPSTKMQRNLNIDGQESGMYLLKITSNGKSIVKKLILEN
jgi:hypothetical protein